VLKRVGRRGGGYRVMRRRGFGAERSLRIISSRAQAGGRVRCGESVWPSRRRETGDGNAVRRGGAWGSVEGIL